MQLECAMLRCVLASLFVAGTVYITFSGQDNGVELGRGPAVRSGEVLKRPSPEGSVPLPEPEHELEREEPEPEPTVEPAIAAPKENTQVEGAVQDTPNVALRRPVSMSGGRNGRMATNGITQVFFGGRMKYADVTPDPMGTKWLEVDLGGDYDISAVEVWVPEVKCHTAMTKPPPNKLKAKQKKGGKKPLPKPPKCDISDKRLMPGANLTVAIKGAGGDVGSCSFNQEHTVYTWAPHNTWWDPAMADHFEQSVERSQSNCRRVWMGMMLPGPGGMGAGFGSTMMYRFGDFAQAISRGQAYLFGGRFNYALNNKYCASKGRSGEFQCYFKHHAPSCANIEGAARKKFQQPSATERDGKCIMSDKECEMNPGKMALVPKSYKRKGLFWVRAMQASFLLRPTDEIHRILEETKEQIGFQGGAIIGVHMRSGDGCRYGIRAKLFPCRSLDGYLPDIRTMASKYGVRKVFLATDSQDLIHQASSNKEFDFISVPTNRAALKSSEKIELRMASKKLDNHGIMLGTVKDMLLLSQCDFLVTHQASTLSRLALQLSTAHHRHVPPYISLDGPWCPHWRMCCDVKESGKRSARCTPWHLLRFLPPPGPPGQALPIIDPCPGGRCPQNLSVLAVAAGRGKD